jgi:NAD(P)-dependent dehydrogenase (short-subunit alcohol dehydrogenase family)
MSTNRSTVRTPGTDSHLYRSYRRYWERVMCHFDPAGPSLEHEIESLGRPFRAFECDIGDSCEVRKCFSRIWDAQIEPDILLNAAGINKRGKVTELTDADIDSVSRVPVVGDSLDEYFCSHAPRSSPSTSKEATSPPKKWQNASYHCRSPARSSTSDL